MQLPRVFLVLAILALLFSNVLAIGMSPAQASAKDLLRGGYAEVSFRVFNTDNYPSRMVMEATGDQASWVTFEPSREFTADAKGAIDVKAVIRPPEDAANGVYSVGIKATSFPQPSSGSGTGAQVDRKSVV